MRALRSASGAAPSTAKAHSSSSVSEPRRTGLVAGGSVETLSGPVAGAGTGAGAAGSSSFKLRRSNGLLNGFFFGTCRSLSVAAHAQPLHLPPQRGSGDIQLPRNLLQAATTAGDRPLDRLPLGPVDLLRERLGRSVFLSAGSGLPLQEDVVRADRVAPRQRGGLLDHVLQLAHVARKRVRGELHQRSLGQGTPRAVALVEPFDEVVGEERDVLAPLAQPR